MEVDGPGSVLAGLDPEQREVALATHGPVCVIAGAGTGKTTAVAHRIAYAVHTGAVDPGHVLAVTFTTRAAGELRARLRLLAGPAGGGMERVTARTFHAAALRQLVHFWPAAVGGPPPKVLDSKISLLSDAAREVGVRPGLPELRDVASEIEWAKVTQMRPADYAEAARKAGRTPPLAAPTVAELFAAYEQLRRQRHLVDFESVLELTAAIVADHRVAAAEVRDRYRYFVVDEYQDVNPLQKLLLDCWLGDRDDVCVVGDPRQTIYSFTGATSAYLTGFVTEFPQATVVRLVRNYRSTPQVVTLANRLTGAIGRTPAAASGYARQCVVSGGTNTAGVGHAAGPPLVAQREGGPEPEFSEYGDENAEAVGVASRARAFLARGISPREIAVLVRTNAQTERFERAFAEVGIPCQVRGAERFFERPEVRQAIHLLRAAVRSMPLAARGTGQAGPAEVSGADGTGRGRDGDGAGPGRGGAARGREEDPALPGAVDEVRNILAGLGHTRDAPAGKGAARDRWESLAAMVQLAEDVCARNPGAGLTEVVAEISRRSALEHPPEFEAVTVASLHAAKGLEWDVVFLPGLAEGTLPIIHADTEEAIAEERRLLYVGITRGRRRVLLSWPLARSPEGRPARTPSRFLDGLRPARRRPLRDRVTSP